MLITPYLRRSLISRYKFLRQNRQPFVINQTYHISKMATAEIATLVSRLEKFGVSASEVKEYPDANLAGNPVDVFRAYISEQLALITGVSRDVIVPALEWTQASDRGDLVLAVPRLRVKGKKPDELAVEWSEKVCQRLQLSVDTH